MRKFLLPALGLVLLLFAGRAAALEPKQIVEKAIKAHGGEKLLTELTKKAGRSLAKGTIYKPIEGDITVESWVSADGKLKVITDMEFMGTAVRTTVVFNGTNAWAVASVAGTTMEVDLGDDAAKEFKEQMYQESMATLVVLNGPEIKLSPLGDGTVDGKATHGIRVSSKGHRDVNLHFDKESGLLLKSEGVIVDFETRSEVTQEAIYAEYQTAKGVIQAKRVILNRDGEKFMEFEVEEVEFLDKIDDSEFSKP